MEGASPARISPIPVSCLLPTGSPSQPRVSHDGKTLAFLVGGCIKLVPLDPAVHDAPVALTQQPCSAGTEMGGGAYCWSKDDHSIIFVAEGKPFIVSSSGGVPRALPMIADFLFYAPTAAGDSVVFCVENKQHIGLCRLSLQRDEWPAKIATDNTFNFDPDIHPKDPSVFVYHAWSHVRISPRLLRAQPMGFCNAMFNAQNLTVTQPSMSWNNSNIVLHKNGICEVITGTTGACAQPRFSPNGEHIAYLSDDANGWLNLFVCDKKGKDRQCMWLTYTEEGAYSTWSTCASTYCWIDNERLVHARHSHARTTLYLLTRPTNAEPPRPAVLRTAGGVYSEVRSVGDGDRFVCLFENHVTPTQLWLMSCSNPTVHRVIAGGGLLIPPEIRSLCVEPKEVTYPTVGGVSHGLFYANCPSSTTPVIVFVHGGPTGMSMDRWNPYVAFFLSRGWSLFLVNHRGSIGYGRVYRESLNQNWGVFDVQDTHKALEHLTAAGLVHPNKAVVMGGSAGGYTTLNCLLTATKFAAGVAMCAVSDLAQLEQHTHLFESQYNHTLVPKGAYKERSPLYRAHEITKPLLMFHGAKDTVVNKEQSHGVRDAVKGPLKYVEFPDEAHMLGSKLGEILEITDAFLRQHVHSAA